MFHFYTPSKAFLMFPGGIEVEYWLEIGLKLKKNAKKVEGSLHKKIKFSMKYFFSKCDQIRRKLQIWSYLLKKFFMENFIFYPRMFRIIDRQIIFRNFWGYRFF